MDWVGITAVIAAAGLALTIGGVVFAFGQSAARLKALEDRVKEDREKNSEQHRDFYDMRDTVVTTSSRFDAIEKRLDKLEEGIMEILRLMPKRERERD